MSTMELSTEDLRDYEEAFLEQLEEHLTHLTDLEPEPFHLIDAMDFLEDSVEFKDFDIYKENSEKLRKISNLVIQHVNDMTKKCDKLEGGCACIFNRDNSKECSLIHIHSHRAEYITDMIKFQHALPNALL
jgi:hypothetical protein